MSFAKLSFTSGPSNRSDLRTGKQSSGEIFFERTNSFRMQKRFPGLRVAATSEANGTLECGGGGIDNPQLTEKLDQLLFVLHLPRLHLGSTLDSPDGWGREGPLPLADGPSGRLGAHCNITSNRSDKPKSTSMTIQQIKQTM